MKCFTSIEVIIVLKSRVELEKVNYLKDTSFLCKNKHSSKDLLRKYRSLLMGLWEIG